jgi:hypothetical protein
MTSLHAMAAAEHQADMHRAAERWRRSTVGPAQDGQGRTQAPEIVLRAASQDDGAVVRRLADLDDAPALEGPVLLALIDGEPAAALSLLDGRVVANPFVLTQDAVALLRLRRTHLSGARRRRRWRTILRPRLALH